MTDSFYQRAELEAGTGVLNAPTRSFDLELTWIFREETTPLDSKRGSGDNPAFFNGCRTRPERDFSQRLLKDEVLKRSDTRGLGRSNTTRHAAMGDCRC